MSKKPHPVDIHVGRKIKQRRTTVGVTQEVLASHLGVSFQQVQKYERGANRVSSSKLYDIALCLGVKPASFFNGYVEGSPAPDGNKDLMMDQLKMSEALADIPDHEQRVALINMARSMGQTT